MTESCDETRPTPLLPPSWNPRDAYRQASERCAEIPRQSVQPEGCERPTIPVPVVVLAPKRVLSRSEVRS